MCDLAAFAFTIVKKQVELVSCQAARYKRV
jgi:hypothetical protein